MNPAGWLLIIGGVWVGCQLLGGDAIGRLNLGSDKADKGGN